jgi:hypothetical protein
MAACPALLQWWPVNKTSAAPVLVGFSTKNTKV